MLQYAVEHFGYAHVPGQPHRGIDFPCINFFKSGTLIQQAQRITHAAFRKTCDKFRRIMCKIKALLPRDILKIFRELRRVYSAKAVALAA